MVLRMKIWLHSDDGEDDRADQPINEHLLTNLGNARKTSETFAMNFADKYQIEDPQQGQAAKSNDGVYRAIEHQFSTTEDNA